MAGAGTLIPARQYARQLNIHPNTVYAWIAKGQLPVERRTAKNGAVRYYVDSRQQPPALALGRPASADHSLSEQLIRARIEYLQARTQALNERRERERKAVETDGEWIQVVFEDDIPAE